MTKLPVLYGYRISYYTRKVYCYLKHKNIDFIEKKPSAYDMYYFQKKVGASVMPVLLTPEGKYIQDSREIIDNLESQYPRTPVIPPTSQTKRRFVANLFEAWTDDMWLAPAMHYRWSYPENFTLFQKETGDSLFPFFFVPQFVKDKAVEKVAGTLRKFLPMAGATDDQKPVLEAWLSSMCDLLDVHFEKHPFVLGSTATIADFGLAGPIVAHLAYDPYPREHVIKPRKYLMAWVDRIQRAGAATTDTSNDDVIPVTLEPLLRAILEEYTPLLSATVDKVNELDSSDKMREKFRMAGKTLPRVMGPISHPLGECSSFKKAAMPFSLWKAQGVLGELPSLGREQREALHRYLTSVHPLGGAALLDLRVPPLTRDALRVKFSNNN